MSQIKLEVPHYDYSEIPQPNPMLWALCHKEGENFYKGYTGWLKCKDFFNDVVYTWRTGKAFEIYGFKAGLVPEPKDHVVYFALKNLKECFKHNIETVLNPWLKSQNEPELKVVSKDPFLLEVSTDYWGNTYRISLLTLLIRLMNYEKFSSWDDVLKHKFPQQEQNLFDTVKKKNLWWRLPKEVHTFVWYEGKDYNSKTVNHSHYAISSYVHNNGVIGWSKHL